AGPHGHGLPPANDLQLLLDEGWNPGDDRALGQLSHAPSVASSGRSARRREPGHGSPWWLLASGDGPPAAARDRARRRLGGRVWIGDRPLEAGLRGRPRLAPAPGVAVRDRGRTGRAWAAPLAGPAIAAPPPEPAAGPAGDRPRSLVLGQRGHLLRRSRDGARVARRRARLHLPRDRGR